MPRLSEIRLALAALLAEPVWQDGLEVHIPPPTRTQPPKPERLRLEVTK